MEGGRTASVGPTPNTNTHSHTHSRPVRASARYFYGNSSSSSTPATFSGPVRRWEKKWVHVSSSQSSTKPRKLFLSNVPNSPHSPPIILCKWTPLSRPSSDVNADGHFDSRVGCRRKFRYTPITVCEENKKPTAKGFADEDKSEETDKSSAEKSVMDGEDFYGFLDINNDFMGTRQGTNEGDLIYTRRSHMNIGLHLETKNKDRHPDLNIGGLWATN